MNFKSALQELCAKTWPDAPKYTTARNTVAPGPDHDPNFDSQVKLPDGRSYAISGVRGNKTAAEQALAQKVFAALQAEEIMRQDLANLPDKPDAFETDFPPPRRPRKKTQPDCEVLHMRCVGRIVRQLPNSVEATCRGMRGKIRISGELAAGLREGMLIELCAKSVFRAQDLQNQE